MNRRHFLTTLTAALAGATLDPERLLWVPGQKTIFLPSVAPQMFFHKDAFAFVIAPQATVNFSYCFNAECFGIEDPDSGAIMLWPERTAELPLTRN